ncbi:10617_t:CDS:2, partial [Funneliformis geosporum]
EKQEEKLRSAKGKNRRIGAGRKAQYPEAEVSLKIWLIEFQKDGIAVTPKMVKTHMNKTEKEMIVKSFKKCGISNAMDGSEDDLFGQNEKEEDINEDEREIVDRNSDSADELEDEESE